MNTTAESRPDLTATVSALSDRELLAQTRDLARVERHLQGTIIDHLAEIDARSLFLRRGYSSLFEYAVRELGYSDAAAARRIGAMRPCAEQPAGARAAARRIAVAERRRRPAVCVRPAATPRARHRAGAGARPPDRGWCAGQGRAHVEPQPPLVLDEVGRRQLVDDAAGKSTRQVRQMLADLDPELTPPADRVRPLGNGRYELKAVIDTDTQQGLEQLRGCLSHVDPRTSVGQLVGRLVQERLERHDPSRPPRRARTGSRLADANAEAKRAPATKKDATAQPGCTAPPPKTERLATCGGFAPKQAVQAEPTAPAAPALEPASDGRAAPPPEPTKGPAARPEEERRTTPAAKPSTSRPAIPAETRREVWQRDEGRCRYVDPQTGRRCISRHLLQIDHVRPYALGGSSDPGKLRLLCEAHHRHRHAPRTAFLDYCRKNKPESLPSLMPKSRSLDGLAWDH